MYKDSYYRVKIGGAVRAIRESAQYYECSTDHVLASLDYNKRLTLPTGAVLCIRKLYGKPHFFIHSMSLGGIDAWRYVFDDDGPYGVYVDGKFICSFPRAYLAGIFAGRIMDNIVAARQVYCSDLLTGKIFNKWRNIGPGKWSSGEKI